MSTARGVLLALALAGVVAPAAGTNAAETQVEVVVDRSLERPMDLAFNPHDGSLWVVNDRAGERNSTVVIRALGTTDQTIEEFVDPSRHYLLDPTAIAFSPVNWEFATSAHGGGGPTLWTSVRSEFHGGMESHLDMVHWTEPALGIAAGADTARREYWVANGRHGSIDRYFFNKPHRLGGTDHADGRVYRYRRGTLRPVPGLPSHAEFDSSTGAVYVADTGNGRIVRFIPGRSLAKARRIQPVRYIPERLFLAPGGTVTTVAHGLQRPVGLLLKDGRLFVGEHATGDVVVVTLDGTVERRIATGVGPDALTGLAASADGAIYFLDARRNRVLKLLG
jgi:hypothetical protein